MKAAYNGDARKRPVTLTLNVDLVLRAKEVTDNLSWVVEALLSDFVAQKQAQRRVKVKTLATTVAIWNHFNARRGSFAIEHSTL